MSEAPKRPPCELPTAEEASLIVRRALDQHLHADHPAHGALAALEGTLAAVTRERDEARIKRLQTLANVTDERNALRAEVEALRVLIAETLALNSLRQDLDCWRFRDGSEDGVDLDAKTVVPHEEAYERRRMKWLNEMHAALTPAEEPQCGGRLRRGVNGVCTRSACECEREGLGDQCIWLRPRDAEVTK